MKFRFYKDEWDLFLENCGFTDDEYEIIPLLRKGWALADVAAELNISDSTLKRRKKSIENKIIRYISMSSL